MSNIKVVIGANFGDEGKGLLTGYFCNEAKKAQSKCIVVLNNGGAQRGHTVDTLDGKSHVFHHFGSGTFYNADTYCSSYFILNPMTFRKEFDEILPTTNIYVNRFCHWSLPYDMIVNQIVEQNRDEKRHGSCGMGIWETEYRYMKLPFVIGIYAFNMLRQDEKRNRLIEIRDSYFINRLKEYGITSVPEAWKDIFYSDILIDNFINDVTFFVDHTTPVVSDKFLTSYDTVVYENGQGLLLDQGLEKFYGNNLTPSNTGSKNIYRSISTVFGVSADIELCYVSRTYMTRHGAGEFVTECNKSNINSSMQDIHNITNEFQGSLRYGELLTDGLLYRVTNDSNFFTYFSNVKSSIAFTHTNEKSADYSLFEKFKKYESSDKFSENVKEII